MTRHQIQTDPERTIAAVYGPEGLFVYRIPPDRSWKWFGITAATWTGALGMLLVGSRFIRRRRQRT